MYLLFQPDFLERHDPPGDPVLSLVYNAISPLPDFLDLLIILEGHWPLRPLGRVEGQWLGVSRMVWSEVVRVARGEEEERRRRCGFADGVGRFPALHFAMPSSTTSTLMLRSKNMQKSILKNTKSLPEYPIYLTHIFLLLI